MLDLVCTKPMRYNRRDLRPRDEFEAVSERDARILVNMGNARERVVEPDPAPVALDDPDQAPSQQRKKRRRRTRNIEPEA